MEILHVSAECYPVAKVGGLADVVGALPKYQHDAGHVAKVVMPAYRNKFFHNNAFEVVHQAGMWLGHDWYHFNIYKETGNVLGFDLYLVDIPGLLDREGVYGYYNDTERFLGFQVAVLDWINEWQHHPDVIQCHDHHTGMIPFLLKYGYKYTRLAEIPSILTIHNAQYQGQFGWDRQYLLPSFDLWKSGLLDWNGAINPLAAGIKSAWKVNTVSPNYMQELLTSANGLEALLNYEVGKTTGILNGIDTEVWDPAKDPMLEVNFTATTVEKGKRENKLRICEQFNMDPELPLMIFIGRLVDDKGADLLPEIIGRSLHESGNKVSFLVLGSGDKHLEWRLEQTRNFAPTGLALYIGYNETLAHQLYAAADFLLMPSRVEPCGLNQMYALRYGTIPIVRVTGGLADTVTDFGDKGGFGIRFVHAAIWDACAAVRRAIALFENRTTFNRIRKQILKIDHSWNKSAQEYIDLYTSLKS
jgi:starch synthase